MANTNQVLFFPGERIYFRAVTVEDVDGNYGRWMTDPDITESLESRFSPLSPDEIKKYVQKMNADSNYLFLAVVAREGDRHIGNIKLGPINWIHRTGEMGGLIGEKDCWGKGYATEAFALMNKLAFELLNLRKVTSGCYATNIGSAKALLKAGFVQEGIRTRQNFFKGTYVDALVFGALRDNSGIGDR